MAKTLTIENDPDTYCHGYMFRFCDGSTLTSFNLIRLANCATLLKAKDIAYSVCPNHKIKIKEGTYINNNGREYTNK